MNRIVAMVLSALVLGGCAASEPRQANIPVSATGPQPLPGTQTDGEASRLVVGAAACWAGGLWADAVGDVREGQPAGGPEKPDPGAIERRCRTLLVHVYGTANPMQYEQLRAIEPRLVDDLALRVRALAEGDRVDRAHSEGLVRLLRAVADAERENVDARRAADDVKKDEAQPSTAAERAEDKTLAAQALQKTTAIDTLLGLDVGDLWHTAHAIGLLCTLDRLEIARGLPKHLKLIAVGGPFARVFGVPPPAGLPEDPTKPVRTGTWPGYLVDVSATAGYAVPAAATEPLDRESLAWGGVLSAFADRLRVDAALLSTRTPLPYALSRIAGRLDEEHRTLVSLFDAEQKHAGR